MGSIVGALQADPADTLRQAWFRLQSFKPALAVVEGMIKVGSVKTLVILIQGGEQPPPITQIVARKQGDQRRQQGFGFTNCKNIDKGGERFRVHEGGDTAAHHQGISRLYLFCSFASQRLKT